MAIFLENEKKGVKYNVYNGVQGHKNNVVNTSYCPKSFCQFLH